MDSKHTIAIQRLDTTLKLENYLLERHLISEEQATAARHTARITRRPVHDVLVGMKVVTDEDICEALASLLDVTPVRIDPEAVTPEALNLVSDAFARRYCILPLELDPEGALVIAMSNPLDILALDDLAMFTNRQIRPVLARKGDILNGIEACYVMDQSLYSMMQDVMGSEYVQVLEIDRDVDDVEELKIRSELAPVVKLGSLIISDAVKMQASDIHIEPQEHYVQLRYRLDGLLKNVMQIPKSFQDSLVSRIKIMGNMDIAERRKPQDGRAKVSVHDRTIDLRISTLPTYFGEKVVLRLLVQESGQTDLSRVGFAPEELRHWESFLAQPQGMLLLTGPTGSGKTTTLYASLERIKSETRNIVTVEDPVEYQIEGLNQVQINPAAGLTFASGLRSILRQDPDVVLVGEIRDFETAEIAFRASMTGHLVLSTLHTNDAVSAVTRLIDIGIPPFLIGSSLMAVAAQRLLRRICPHCAERYTPDAALLELYRPYLGPADHEFRIGRGCDECNYTGYRGRTAILEIFRITDRVKPLITAQANEQALAEAARRDGMASLVEAAVRKVIEGVTTLEECARVAYRTNEDLQLCPACHSPIQREFNACPYCRHVVNLQCPGCRRTVRHEWTLCPYCSEDLEGLATRPAASGAGAAGARMPVLVVHADAAQAARYAEALAPLGFPVVTAASLEAARERLHEAQAAMLLLHTPQADDAAFEFCQELRARVDTSLLPIVLFTEETLTADQLARYRDVGADDYLAGGFDAQMLCKRARFLLELRERIPAERDAALDAADLRHRDDGPYRQVYARLRVVDGPDAGAAYELHASRTTLGRSPNNDIQLQAKNISRFHVQIVRDNGHVILKDVDSRNGTLVNGEPVDEALLHSGDQLRLGELLLVYEAAGETEPVLSEASRREAL